MGGLLGGGGGGGGGGVYPPQIIEGMGGAWPPSSYAYEHNQRNTVVEFANRVAPGKTGPII